MERMKKDIDKNDSMRFKAGGMALIEAIERTSYEDIDNAEWYTHEMNKKEYAYEIKRN